jgi:hypothetical protein
LPAVLDAVVAGVAVVLCGPQVAQVKESVRPLCPPEKACAVLVRAELLLEVPPGPHPGQFAEGNRVADDEAKFAIDETDIYRILPWLLARPHPAIRKYRRNERLAITVIGFFPIAPVLTAVSIIQH